MFADNLKDLFTKDSTAKLLKRKMGRPRKEIDFDMLEQLCMIQCTLEEIASCFRVSEDTIERRVKEEYNITFAEYYKQFSGFGKASLRRQQFAEAMKGNVKMLKWLGSNHLGQSSKSENINSNTNENINKNIDLDLSKLSDEELEKEMNRIDEIIHASKQKEHEFTVKNKENQSNNEDLNKFESNNESND